MSQSNTDHHFETNFKSSCIFLMQRTKNVHPFYIAVKKKRGMSIRNCVKSMEVGPIAFQKQYLAMTDFSDKTLNCKLQSYLFLRRPYERSYCARKGIKLSVLTFSKFI